ncbi:MAG: DNA-processing protein DprA [Dethiobacter sp.]|jgi:DNA processing protein|nr:DNA-processing protein DprA [Dethiobacter sp.]
MDDTVYWLALSLVSELGARRIRRLVEYFGSARQAFSAGADELYLSGVAARAVEALLAERKRIEPYLEWERLIGGGISLVTLFHPHYPQLLQQIYDPPTVLFYRGDLGILEMPCIAVVGARKATEYGKTVAFRLSADLARSGIAVVSGMARGIDTSAHQGALQSGGKTAAILGCGLDICYPPENLRLRERIAGSGVIVSEFPPGTQPKPAHFPLRNRIISGLSLATVVVEAGEKSGALITADCALEHGREVFAVPGSVNSPNSRGCHRLLKEGAALAENAGDILLELGLNAKNEIAKTCELTPEQMKILVSMEFEPVHFDDLLVRCGVEASALAAAMVELELASIVRKMPGNYYLRV